MDICTYWCIKFGQKVTIQGTFYPRKFHVDESVLWCGYQEKVWV